MRLLAVSHPCVVDVNQGVYREVEQLGNEVAIVVPDRWRHDYSETKIHPARLKGFTGPIIPLPVFNPGNVPLHGYCARLARIIAKLDPDVLYIEAEPYSVSAFQWSLAAARRRVPTLFFAAQNIAKRYPLPFRLSERFVWRHSRGAICVTSSIARTLESRGYRGQSYVVPHAADLSNFRVQPRDETLRKRLGLQPQVVAYVGRLVEEKGIRVLLEAACFRPMPTSTSLLFIGDGPLAAECRQQSGAVVVTGISHVQVPQYLSLADVVVLPSLTTRSWKEQFGRVVIEALACGVPVIGSDSGEIPYLLEATGGGLVVAEGDAAALSEAIAMLLGNPAKRRELATRGWQRVQSGYSTTAVANELARALEAAVAGY
jgi:glycosyltransferase involved in cell wall biosynthesis